MCIPLPEYQALTLFSSDEYGRKLLEENDMKNILVRLDQLTPGEARRSIMPTLEVVYRLINNLTLVIGGEYALLGTLRMILTTSLGR